MPDTPEKDSGVAEEPKEIETNGEVETNDKGNYMQVNIHFGCNLYLFILVMKNEQTYFNLVYLDLDTKSSPKNEASPPEANTNSTGNIISLFVGVDIKVYTIALPFDHIHKNNCL